MARRVKCKVCGKTFELQRSNYVDGNRYVCDSCANSHNREVRKQKKEYMIQRRLAKTGMRQSYFAMILKLLFGLLIFSVAFEDISDLSVFLPELIIGVASILWAVIPFCKRKKVKARYSFYTFD